MLNRCKISEWEVVLRARGIVNMPCIKYDTASVTYMLKRQITSMEPKIYEYKNII